MFNWNCIISDLEYILGYVYGRTESASTQISCTQHCVFSFWQWSIEMAGVLRRPTCLLVLGKGKFTTETYQHLLELLNEIIKDVIFYWQPVEGIHKTSFMAERRRKKSGDSRPPSRLSLEISAGIKLGRQGKRELLQTIAFRGAYAQHVVSDPSFSKFVVVDDTGVYYLLETLTAPLV